MNQITIKKTEAEIVTLLKSKQFATATGWLIISILLYVWPVLAPNAMLFIVLWTVIVALLFHTFTPADVAAAATNPPPPEDVWSALLAEFVALRTAMAGLTPAVEDNTKTTTLNSSAIQTNSNLTASNTAATAAMVPYVQSKSATTDARAPQGSDQARTANTTPAPGTGSPIG